MKNCFAVIFAAVILGSCSGTHNTKKDNLHMSASDSSEVKMKEKSQSKPNESTSKTIDELLIGKWQHTEDKENILEFTHNMRIEIGEGMTEADEEPYELALSCMNEPQTEGTEDPNQVYIWCPASFMCWEILSVNEKNLTLIYTSRGNLLTYKRIK